MSQLQVPLGWFEGVLSLLILMISGWIARIEILTRRNEEKIEQQKEKINDLELTSARSYHTKDEFREILHDALSVIKSDLDRISRSVDRIEGRSREP